MKISKIRIGAVTIFFFLQIVFTQEKKQLKLTNFICESLDEEFAVVLHCNIKAIKRDVSSVNFACSLKTVIRDGLVLNWYLKKRGNVRNPTVYNVTLDACNFIGNRNKYTVTNIIYMVMGLEGNSNLNHSCPYEGEVVLKDYRLNEKYLNLLPIPYGQYWFNAKLYYLSRYVLYFEVAFQFYEKDVNKNITQYRPI